MRISIRLRTTVRAVPVSHRFVRGTAHLQTTHLQAAGSQSRKTEGEGDHRLPLPPPPPLVGLQENLQEMAQMVRGVQYSQL